MIRTTIRFHEDLLFFLSSTNRNNDIDANSLLPRSVKDLIESYGVPHVEVDFILVNGSPVDFKYLVCDGDFIRVFPWGRVRPGRLGLGGATRGRVTPSRVQPGSAGPDREAPRFIADVHLKTLVRRLRMLGFDTLYDPGWSDKTLAARSNKDNRILLSRDRRLLMRNSVIHGLYIRNTDPKQQVVEVVKRFDLLDTCSPLSRCIPCNGMIERVKIDEGSEAANAVACAVAHAALPTRVRERNKDFYRCRDCGKFYWRGTHVDRMLETLEEIRHYSAMGGIE